MLCCSSCIQTPADIDTPNTCQPTVHSNSQPPIRSQMSRRQARANQTEVQVKGRRSSRQSQQASGRRWFREIVLPTPFSPFGKRLTPPGSGPLALLGVSESLLAQDGPRGPSIAQDCLQDGTRKPQMAQDGLQNASKKPQDGPKWPRSPPRTPRRHQPHSKTQRASIMFAVSPFRSRWAIGALRWPQHRSRQPKEGAGAPRRSQ